MLKKIILFCFLFSFFSLSLLSGNFRVQAVAKQLAPHQAGELLIKLKNVEQVLKFKFANDAELHELLQFYNDQPAVAYAEPNYLYQTVGEPLDDYYPQQIYLSLIKANQAWNITTGSAQVTIAVIDTGVDIKHPDLKDNLWFNPKEIAGNGIDDDENGYTDDVNGWDFVTNNNDPAPKLVEPFTKTGINHGTVVAGVAAARGGNHLGVAGVAWNVKIMSLRALDGLGTGTTDKVAEAIDYALKQKIQVINLSFVGSGNSKTLEAAVKRAYEAGVILVAAAGNEVAQGVDMDLPDNKMYPICYTGPAGEDWVLGVAATDNDKRLASFSNYGVNCIDISAPGLRVFSTVFHDDTNFEFKDYYLGGWTGSSVSTPQVAGTVALIKSLKPGLSLEQVQKIIENSAENIDGLNRNFVGKLGAGLLNVYQALNLTVTEQPTKKIQQVKILTAAGAGGGPHVKIFKMSSLESEFFAYDSRFRGGLSLAGGDLDQDGSLEVVAGLGRGAYPWAKIFSSSGALLEQLTPFTLNFKGGVEVATADVDGDGLMEIITTAGTGGGPHIRFYSATGILEGQFFAYSKNFWGGVEVAAADINGDGLAEIITVPKNSLEPLVKIFNQRGEMIGLFLADKKEIKKGLHVAAADLNGDNKAEIIIGASAGSEPWVKIFDSAGVLKANFLAFAKNFRGGVWVAGGDIDGDNLGEVVTGAGVGGGPQVRIFQSDGQLENQFFAYDERFRGGVRVAVEGK